MPEIVVAGHRQGHIHKEERTMAAEEAVLESLVISNVVEVGEKLIAPPQKKSRKLSAAEIEECRTAATTVVAGFPALNHERFEELKRQRKAAVKKPPQEFNDQGVLEEALRSHGISHFGIVPHSFWEGVCGTQLVRVQPDGQGSVWISGKILDDAKRGSKYPKTTFVVGAGVALGLALLLFESLWGLGVTAPIVYLVANRVHGAISSLRLRQLIRKSAARPWSAVIADLFPNGREERDVWKFAARIVWNSPAPDPNIMGKIALLTQDRDFVVEVAAEPEAIRFTQPIEELFLDGAAKHEAAEKFKRADPIICVRYGSVTAVIEQVGDFEFEKAAVNAAVEKYIGISTK